MSVGGRGGGGGGLPGAGLVALNVHFKVRTGPQKGSSGEENTQSTLHMALRPYRIRYVLPALLGVCVV